MKWLEQLKSREGSRIALLLLAGILLLVIALPSGSGTRETPSGAEPETAAAPALTQEERLERRLQEILSKVEGIGRTEVMITLKSDGRQVVEKDQELQEGREESQEEGTAGSSSQVNSSESTVYQKDGSGSETPYVKETLAPEISGVLVIAEGGKNPVTAAEITEAVMALFGVEAHKIKVMKME